MLAFTLIHTRAPEKAVELMKRAFRLNPIPPPTFYAHLGIAFDLTGQHLDAIEACKNAITKSPDFVLPYITMALAYSSLEQHEKAHETVTEILKKDPRVSIELMAMYAPYEQKADLDNLLERMRKAGFPEHSPKER
jgi:tetratricopeptide (TPR) repeat protein